MIDTDFIKNVLDALANYDYVSEYDLKNCLDHLEDAQTKVRRALREKE